MSEMVKQMALPSELYPADEVWIVPIASLTPHPRNYRVHPDDQLAHIIESIRTHGIYRPVIVARGDVILAGHGVVMAAQKMGLEEVPIVRLDLEPDDPRALKLLTGDNEISHLGEVDDRALAAILSQIRAEDEAGLLGTGFDEKLLADLITHSHQASEEPAPTYTASVQVPTYEPSGEMPALPTLFSNEKTNTLIQAIEASEGITEEERAFLILAAQRHTVLHFNKIADYYAQASEPMQELMEQSALVIIDFDRAIELGYVDLTRRMAGLVEDEYGE